MLAHIFNTHTLALSPAGMKKLDKPYMRAVRKIAGVPLHAAGQASHAVARGMLKAPSVDCLIARARLCFLKRLLELLAQRLDRSEGGAM